MSTVWTQNCDRCGALYQSRHCKLSCDNCGAHLDCSDLFIDWERVQKTRRDKHRQQHKDASSDS